MQGIGEGIARSFARHGANLILLDISLRSKSWRTNCVVVVIAVRRLSPMCVTRRRSPQLSSARRKEGRIDILVNNAGVVVWAVSSISAMRSAISILISILKAYGTSRRRCCRR
ncbi:SDR family oxidoreductase [Escherichia coli]